MSQRRGGDGDLDAYERQNPSSRESKPAHQNNIELEIDDILSKLPAAAGSVDNTSESIRVGRSMRSGKRPDMQLGAATAKKMGNKEEDLDEVHISEDSEDIFSHRSNTERRNIARQATTETIRHSRII